MRKIDITGQVFGRLTVFCPSVTIARASMWSCVCVCGNSTSVSLSNLKRGWVTSCGCFWRQRITKHGMSNTTEYRIWQQMIQRCTNPKNQGYIRYGGRGITVCNRWLKFKHFLKDMGLRPSKQHSIERVDNDGGYSPSNCVWATRKDQSRNQTTSKFLVINGVKKSIAQWGEEHGLRPSVIYRRINRGWKTKDLLIKSDRSANKRRTHQLRRMGL